MRDRYQMVIEAVDRIMAAGEPEPEEERQEEEPIPPRKHRHPQDIYTDWPSNEQCEAFKRGWR